MKLRHLKWGASSRIFEELDNSNKPTGRLVEKINVGQRNIRLDNNTFAPYEWIGPEKRLKFGRCEVNFLTDRIRVIHPKGDFDFSLYPEFEGQQKPPVVSGLRFTETKTAEIIIDDSKIINKISKDFIEISYDLETEDSIETVTLKAGCNNTINFRFKRETLKQGNFTTRLNFFEKGIENVVYDRNEDLMVVNGLIFSGMPWIWKLDEIGYHSINQKQDTTEVELRKGFFDVGQINVVSPDTFNPVANDDDGHENNGTWSSGVDDGCGTTVFQPGYPTGTHIHGLLRFDNITLDGTVDTSTIDTYWNSCNWWDNASFDWKIEDADDPGVFSATHRPGNGMTLWGAIADQTEHGDQVETSPELKTLVQHVMDRGGWSSGNAMCFCLYNTDDQWDWGSTHAIEEGDNNEAELTIVMVVAGDAMPMAMNTYRQMRN
jgi:hypothetical protein